MEALIWDILPEMVPLILGCVALPYKSRTLNHRGRAELTACSYQWYVSASGPQARGDKQPENKNRHLLFLAHVQMPDVLTGIRRVSSCILDHLDLFEMLSSVPFFGCMCLVYTCMYDVWLLHLYWYIWSDKREKIIFCATHSHAFKVILKTKPFSSSPVNITYLWI